MTKTYELLLTHEERRIVGKALLEFAKRCDTERRALLGHGTESARMESRRAEDLALGIVETLFPHKESR